MFMLSQEGGGEVLPEYKEEQGFCRFFRCVGSCPSGTCSPGCGNSTFCGDMVIDCQLKLGRFGCKHSILVQYCDASKWWLATKQCGGCSNPALVQAMRQRGRCIVPSHPFEGRKRSRSHLTNKTKQTGKQRTSRRRFPADCLNPLFAVLRIPSCVQLYSWG